MSSLLGSVGAIEQKIVGGDTLSPHDTVHGRKYASQPPWPSKFAVYNRPVHYRIRGFSLKLYPFSFITLSVSDRDTPLHPYLNLYLNLILYPELSLYPKVNLTRDGLRKNQGEYS